MFKLNYQKFYLHLWLFCRIHSIHVFYFDLILVSLCNSVVVNILTT